MNFTITKIAKVLHQNGWLANCDGNISRRLDHKILEITPRGRPKFLLNPNELVHISILPLDQNNQIASSEQAMHKFVYHHAPLANAVVHAHPPYATAWGVQKNLEVLPEEYLSEGILACGSIPIVPYARPGTLDMGEHLEPFLPGHRVLILGHHGALTWGESLSEAYFAMERLEHLAKTIYLAKTLGTPKPLPSDEISRLKALRKKMGKKVL